MIKKGRGKSHFSNMVLNMLKRPETGVLMVGSRMFSIRFSGLCKRTIGVEAESNLGPACGGPPQKKLPDYLSNGESSI